MDIMTSDDIVDEVRPCYLLRYDDLQLADIVLTSDDSAVSTGIRLKTGGPASHAMLYVGHSLIEATVKGGVFSHNPQRLFRARADQFIVLRAKKPLSTQEANHICNFAREKVGSLYSVAEALRTVRAGPAGAQTRRQFCSRLVAQAYGSVGRALASSVDYCSPNDLWRSPALEPVGGLVRLATTDDLELIEAVNQPEVHQRSLFAWLKQVRQMASTRNDDVQTLSDVADFVLRHPDLDGQVVAALERTTYLRDHVLDLEAAPYKYRADLLVERISPAGELIPAILERELVKEERIAKVYEHNLGELMKAAHLNLVYFQRQIALYRALINMSRARCVVLRRGSAAFNLSDQVDGADALIAFLDQVLGR
jgi:hypothetical protein